VPAQTNLQGGLSKIFGVELRSQHAIDAVDDPAKQAAIEGLGSRVSGAAIETLAMTTAATILTTAKARKEINKKAHII